MSRERNELGQFIKGHSKVGEYKRDRSDWVMLCPSCHRKIDMGKEELCVL